MTAVASRMGATGLALLLVAGCSQSPTVWVEEDRQLQVSADDLNSVRIRTHNGSIGLAGSNRPDLQVLARCKAGGKTRESAEEAMSALEIVSKQSNKDQHLFTYEWSTAKRNDWKSQVSFDIEMPGHLAVDAQTHNGGIKVDGVNGKCHLTTHNGAVAVKSSLAPIHASTHNGGISAVTAGAPVQLTTNNGAVKLDATGASALDGYITTHNGGVSVTVGEQTAAELTCQTHNGRVTCDVPWEVSSIRRNYAKGKLHGGGSKFVARTHNGSIHVRKSR